MTTHLVQGEDTRSTLPKNVSKFESAPAGVRGGRGCGAPGSQRQLARVVAPAARAAGANRRHHTRPHAPHYMLTAPCGGEPGSPHPPQSRGREK